MTIYDYIVIGFYLAFMLSLGLVFKSFSKTSSDYFRCGGGMVWWLAGSSAFMNMFTAWAFTGGAAKAYETGTFFLLLFLCNFIGLWFTYFFTAARFRQMRIITYIEAVRKRFGNANEQVFTWLPVPFNIIMGGLALYTISVFMHSVFGIDMTTLIITLGITVTFMTLVGGAWAATAGDFVQMLLVLTITLVMGFLTIKHPDIGGVTELIKKLPEHHFNWTMFDRPWVILFFALTLMINQLVQNNSMFFGASKFVFVKNGKDAKKSTLVSILGFLLLSPIWMIPAVAATIIHPNLAAEYPKLNNPNEAAYVAMAVEILPKGLLGFLVCAIFAASVTSMNSQISIAAGVFVRNFFIRIVEKGASEAKQILVGRIFIFIYGLLWIIVAMIFKNFEKIKLFDLLLLLAASIQIPTTVPLFLGIFVKRTPSWSGWSTMVAGFTISVALLIMFKKIIPPADFFVLLFSPAVPFTGQEVSDMRIAFTTAVLFFVCISWFFGTKLFYKEENKEYAKQVDKFFEEMNTPIDMAKEHGPSYDSDSRQYRVLGNLCIVYGAFILLLMFIPNPWRSRLCILFCGATTAIIGLVLSTIGFWLKKKSITAAIVDK